MTKNIITPKTSDVPIEGYIVVQLECGRTGKKKFEYWEPDFVKGLKESVAQFEDGENNEE